MMGLGGRDGGGGEGRWGVGMMGTMGLGGRTVVWGGTGEGGEVDYGRKGGLGRDGWGRWYCYGAL